MEGVIGGAHRPAQMQRAAREPRQRLRPWTLDVKPPDVARAEEVSRGFPAPDDRRLAHRAVGELEAEHLRLEPVAGAHLHERPALPLRHQMADVIDEKEAPVLRDALRADDGAIQPLEPQRLHRRDVDGFDARAGHETGIVAPRIMACFTPRAARHFGAFDRRR